MKHKKSNTFVDFDNYESDNTEDYYLSIEEDEDENEHQLTDNKKHYLSSDDADVKQKKKKKTKRKLKTDPMKIMKLKAKKSQNNIVCVSEDEEYLLRCKQCSVLRDYFGYYLMFVDNTRYNICTKCCANNSHLYERYMRKNTKKWKKREKELIKNGH